MEINSMEVVKTINTTHIELVFKLNEIFTPKPSIVFVTKEIKPKKTQ